MFQKEEFGEYIKILKFWYRQPISFRLQSHYKANKKNVAVLPGGGTPGRDH